jgi:uncharacterized protein (DUF885 family)
MPDGARVYQYFIESNTTLKLTPNQIFELGQRDLARIRARLAALKTESGFSGELRDWARQVRMRAARYKTADEIIAAYWRLHAQVEPQLTRLFPRPPEARFEIRPVEAWRELGAANQYWRGGRGRPGVFYVNLRSLRYEPVPISVNLFLHETIPGHHLQLAIARENSALPNFRRVAGYAAYTEGWAMYAEMLGYDLGLYNDFSAELGFLASQLWSACNLVADVGINSRGWTREQTIQFLRDNLISAELGPADEASYVSIVERFMARPGYALSYRIGQLTITELRDRAKGVLGARFDLRAFHDELLKDGAMPLQILKEKMERWIHSHEHANRETPDRS